MILFVKGSVHFELQIVSSIVMSFGQGEILVDAENKVPSVTAIRYSSLNAQVVANVY